MRYIDLEGQHIRSMNVGGIDIIIRVFVKISHS